MHYRELERQKIVVAIKKVCDYNGKKCWKKNGHSKYITTGSSSAFEPLKVVLIPAVQR